MLVSELNIANKGDSDRYERLFEACPDAFIQQSAWWADCIAELGPDRPIFLIATDGSTDAAGLPLYLFKGRSGSTLTSVPQPGPLGGVFTLPGLSAEQANRAYAALLKRAAVIARQHDCLTMTLITNPFADDLELYERHLAPDYVFENFTQFVPLGQPPAWSHGHRNNLNRAKRAGFTVECASSEADLKSWYEVHASRHREIGAQPLDFRLFQNLFSRLMPMGKAKLVLVKRDGEIASGGFYVRHEHMMDVFMLSVNPAFIEDSPVFLNTEHSLEWAASTGATVYNWQSSHSKNCGVYHFKRQWGSVERPYYFVTKRFCDESRLRALGRERISREYPYHYVAPFGLFDSPEGVRRFGKP